MSSSEDDVAMLREAVDPQFAGCFRGKDAKEDRVENTNGKTGQRITSNAIKCPTSSRPNYTNDSDYDDHGMTPEFKSYLAKKLSEILESKIKMRNGHLSNPATESPPEENQGIRLLASSKVCIANEEESPCQKRRKPDLLKKSKNRKKKSANSSSSSSDDDMEQLASVAVSSDWVLSKKGVYDSVKSTVDAEGAEQGTVVPNKTIAEGDESEHRSSGHHKNVCRKKKHKDTEDKEERNKRRSDQKRKLKES